ncbi:universal stress protein [Terriglobus sp. ADX1]|uniref:universal stress protein n=1 Tax=Terriglobus sp. ADX1 TaxID=2794063 RepID=UPI002FE68C70
MSETHVPTIVVATDFSESSLVAMSFALALSKLLKRRLLLLHIFTYVPKHRYSIPVDWMDG